jgi:hypothetical protein
MLLCVQVVVGGNITIGATDQPTVHAVLFLHRSHGIGCTSPMLLWMAAPAGTRFFVGGYFPTFPSCDITTRASFLSVSSSSKVCVEDEKEQYNELFVGCKFFALAFLILVSTF